MIADSSSAWFVSNGYRVYPYKHIKVSTFRYPEQTVSTHIPLLPPLLLVLRRIFLVLLWGVFWFVKLMLPLGFLQLGYMIAMMIKSI